MFLHPSSVFECSGSGGTQVNSTRTLVAKAGVQGCAMLQLSALLCAQPELAGGKDRWARE